VRHALKKRSASAAPEPKGLYPNKSTEAENQKLCRRMKDIEYSDKNYTG